MKPKMSLNNLTGLLSNCIIILNNKALCAFYVRLNRGINLRNELVTWAIQLAVLILNEHWATLY